MIDGPIDRKLAADNTVNRGRLLSAFLKQLSNKLSFIEKETNAVLDERDAQSLLLDRIQYYADMWSVDGDNASHSLGHIVEELKLYADHHLLGTFPPCVVNATDSEMLLRDGTRVEIDVSSVHGGARLRVIETET